MEYDHHFFAAFIAHVYAAAAGAAQDSFAIGQERVDDLLLGVDVLGRADVAALELVGIAWVDDDRAVDGVRVVAVEQARHGLGRDAVEVAVLQVGARAGKDVGRRAVTD